MTTLLSLRRPALRFAALFAATMTALILLALPSATHAQAGLPETSSFIRSLEERTQLQEATRAYRRGDLAPALEMIERYLKDRADDPQAQFLRGLILVDQRRLDEALMAFILLSQQYPELAEPYNNIAVLYAARGELARAREALERAVLANPADPTARENLGDVYMRLATQSYEKAIALDPKNRSAGTKLAIIRDMTTKNTGEKK